MEKKIIPDYGYGWSSGGNSIDEPEPFYVEIIEQFERNSVIIDAIASVNGGVFIKKYVYITLRNVYEGEPMYHLFFFDKKIELIEDRFYPISDAIASGYGHFFKQAALST